MVKSILLAEDDPFLIDIYTKKLKAAGFDIKVAEDGATVLRMLQEEKPDLLLLDIVLPQVEGWEIISQLRADPKFADLKIVVWSNLGQRGEVEKGLRLGADRYMIKAQYTPSEVVEEIKKILNPKS